MSIHKALVATVALAGLVSACKRGPQRYFVEVAPPTAVFETNKGKFVVELNPELAPKTTAFVSRHVRGGFYNGLAFHRVIPESVAQTGRMTPERRIRRSMEQPLESESANGLTHKRGAVGLARVTGRPHSGNTQFFVNLTDNPVLNFTTRQTDRGWGYTVFGRVIEGMNVLDAIGRVDVVESGSRQFWPLEPVVIDTSYMLAIEVFPDTVVADSATEESDR